MTADEHSLVVALYVCTAGVVITFFSSRRFMRSNVGMVETLRIRVRRFGYILMIGGAVIALKVLLNVLGVISW